MRPPSSDRRQFAWGLADQTVASATTFALTIVAARSLGPAGLGTVAIGYAAFLLVLGLNRALVVDPLITLGDSSFSRDAIACATTVTVAGCALVGCILLGSGALASGATRHALLAFGPWIGPAVLLSMLRAVAFRRRNGALAALGSAIALGVFAGLAGAGFRGSPGALVAAWGIGASAGSFVLAAVLRVRLDRPASALRWVRTEALTLGRWLGATSVIGAALSYALVLGLTQLVGAAAIGGYRAIESAFSGFSLVAGSLVNPGIASMQRAELRSPAAARRLAIRLSVFAALSTAVYGVLIGAGRQVVLAVIGERFAPYLKLIVPIAIGQTLLAASLGFVVLLKVRRRGRDVFVVSVLGPLCSCAVGLWFAASSGIQGAAWGIAIGSLTLLMLAVLQSGASEPEPSAVEGELSGSRA